jgi:cell division protein FtsL
MSNNRYKLEGRNFMKRKILAKGILAILALAGIILTGMAIVYIIYD